MQPNRLERSTRLQFTVPRTLCHCRTSISRWSGVSSLLADDVRWWLLVNDQALCLLERIESLLFNAIEQIRASRDVVNQADDLASSPYLSK